jgi:hypothetical protein
MVRVLTCIALLAMTLAAQQPSAPPALDTRQNNVEFTDAEGADVLHSLAGALEAHSLRRFLNAFDPDAYPRFPTFSAEMDSYFGRYDSFRVHYNLKQTTTGADGHGVLIAQIQMDEEPVGTGESVRHNAELRFELARTNGKWKIVAFSPRDFLS